MTLRKTLCFLTLVFFTAALSAQKIERADPMKQWPYTYEGRKLNQRALKEILMTEVSSVVEVQKTRPARTVSVILSGAGGYLIGRQIGIGLNSRRFTTSNGRLFGYGGGSALILTGLLIDAGTVKHLHRGVKRYNEAQDKVIIEQEEVISFRVGGSTDGLGLRVTF